MAEVGVLCSKLNFYPLYFNKRGLKILISKLHILISEIRIHLSNVMGENVANTGKYSELVGP